MSGETCCPNCQKQYLGLLERREARIRELQDQVINLQLQVAAAQKGLKIVPSFKFDFEGMLRVAQEVMMIRDPAEAHQWVLDRLQDLVDCINNLVPEDCKGVIEPRVDKEP